MPSGTSPSASTAVKVTYLALSPYSDFFAAASAMTSPSQSAGLSRRACFLASFGAVGGHALSGSATALSSLPFSLLTLYSKSPTTFFVAVALWPSTPATSTQPSSERTHASPPWQLLDGLGEDVAVSPTARHRRRCPRSSSLCRPRVRPCRSRPRAVSSRRSPASRRSFFAFVAGVYSHT